MERKRIEKMKLLAIEIQRHFKNFYLSGGTALMIKHKHRISEDLDFFSKSAGRRIESKDIIDFAFLWKKYKWERKKVKMDFERKFPHQSFEIYLGAVFAIEDYSSKIIKEVMKEWKV
jgi:hypothetical protein